MDSPSAAQSELLVAVQGRIGYKRGGGGVLKANTHMPVKRPYQKPMLRVYGDIRTMTQAVAATRKHSDGRMALGKTLKTS
jgi:hypothetical protein